MKVEPDKEYDYLLTTFIRSVEVDGVSEHDYPATYANSKGLKAILPS